MNGDRKSPSNFVDVGLGLNVSTISSRSWIIPRSQTSLFCDENRKNVKFSHYQIGINSTYMASIGVLTGHMRAVHKIYVNVNVKVHKYSAYTNLYSQMSQQ